MSAKRYQKRTGRTSVPMKILLAVMLVVFCFSGYMVVSQLWRGHVERSANATLAEQVSTAEAEESENPKPETVVVPAPENSQAGETEVSVLHRYAELYKTNTDMAAWLRMPAVGVDLPVMCTPNDPNYYLRRGFDKFYAESGCLFIGAEGSANTDCVVIYGHNMNDGSMFGKLQQYETEKFWQENPVFSCNTLDELREYEIFAAMKTRAILGSEPGFRYHNCCGDLTEAEYNELVQWLRSNAAYDTGIVPEYGEQILILSTCSYHTDNGRFIVAARRVQKAEE